MWSSSTAGLPAREVVLIARHTLSRSLSFYLSLPPTLPSSATQRTESPSTPAMYWEAAGIPAASVIHDAFDGALPVLFPTAGPAAHLSVSEWRYVRYVPSTPCIRHVCFFVFDLVFFCGFAPLARAWAT